MFMKCLYRPGKNHNTFSSNGEKIKETNNNVRIQSTKSMIKVNI